ncbi:hypothetical protein AB0478_30115 [Streptomyces sp. NPDC051917]|uniref:hypothetical protein n=1 Tax=Streptomyces sp. NPDC051917 TaxID=3154754 RepID=UPI00344C8A4A
MPSSTTARRRTAPVNPDATRVPSRHGLLTGTGTGLGLVQPAGPVAVPVTAGRTASSGPARQRADRVRAQHAARDTRQVKALTAQARSVAARPAPVFRQMDAAAMPALDSAVNSHRQGLAAPDPLARPLTAATASQRHRAVDVRSIEASEPDAIDIDAGPGHQHVFPRMTPDGQALTTPHDRPEGSARR